MPRVIQTLWFEDIGIMHEPVFSTPIGRYSMRQLAGIGFFGLLAWGAFALLGFTGDVFIRGIAAASILVLGFAIFTMRVKTVPPERAILLLIRPAFKPSKKARLPEKRMEAKPVRVKQIPAVPEEPVKIIGMLRDPSTGRVLPNKAYEVVVDGKPAYEGSSDEQGFFQVYFMPPRVGVFKVEVRAKDFAGTSEAVDVVVREGGVRVGEK